MLEHAKQKLVATIYAATLSPQGFNELFVDLSIQMEKLVEELTGESNITRRLPHSSEHVFDQDAIADLAEHVRIAHAIQSRIGHFDDSSDKIQFIVDSVPNPAVVFDENESIVAVNGLSRVQQGARSRTLAEVIGSADELAHIRKAVAGELGRNGEFASVPLVTNLAKGQNTCALIKKIQKGGRNGKQADLYLLAVADFGFDENVRVAIRDSYRLTDAEASVAVLLASGATTVEIARQRAVSLETVRSQIKAIKHKTQVRDIPHLVRLMCGYSAGILVPNGMSEPAQSVLVKGHPASSAMFTLGDGRTMEYIVQGAPDGHPVLLFHNLPYGAVLPEAAIRAVARKGLKIIAPLRPGQGRSDPLPGVAREKLLNQVARDMDELLTALGAPKVALIGNVGGSAFALRFASLYPQKVSRIVMVSRAPIWRGEWLAGMPRRQKLISMLLRHLPTMANVLVWAILSYVNRQDGGDFLRESVKESEADLKALDNPETMRLMVDGIKFGLVQGPEAFCRDWEAMEIDMTVEARSLPHPMFIIQGAEDRITRPEFSHAFVEEVPATTLDIVEGAGNLLFYSHWQRVVDRL